MIRTVSHSAAAFSLIIPATIHDRADLESQQYLPSYAKVEQIYLSHLASYSVQYYLNLCGYKVNDQNGRSQDFLDRALSDSARVMLPGYGSIGCLVVPEGQNEIDLPSLIRTTPIGYIAVAFDDDLTEAQLIGFVPQRDSATVTISELHDLTDLPSYLAQLNPAQSVTTQLSRWWNRSIDQGWTLIAELTEQPGAEASFAFRSEANNRDTSIVSEPGRATEKGSEDEAEDGLICHKQITLSNVEGSLTLALRMERFAVTSGPGFSILAQLTPNLGQAFLPENIQMIASDDSQTVFSTLHAQAESPALTLRFKADLGDYFSLKIALAEVSTTESFIV